MKKVYNTLEELRAAKETEAHKLRLRFGLLQQDAEQCLVPSNNMFLKSGNKYMRFAGYAITAYKTFNTVRNVVELVRKWKR